MSWEWYDDLNTKCLFIHCLLKANHKGKKWRGETINKGSFITSRSHLSIETNLSEQQVRTALKKLESTNEITIESTKLNTLISIVNWDKYQGDNQQSNQPTNQAVTNYQPSSNQAVTTTNNDNKENNENNVNNKEGGKHTAKSKSFSPDIYSIYDSVINHFPEDLRPNTEKSKIKWLDEIRKMIEIDGETKEAIIYVVEKIRADDFWNKNFLSLLKLRKKDGNEVTYMNVFKAHIKSNRNKTGAIQGIKVESQKHYEEWK